MTKTTDKNPTVTKSKPKQKTKASIVEALLERKDGASLEAIGKATGWQAHSSRAFLSGLRKKGRELIRYKDDKGASLYKLTPLDAGGANA
ncbi:MAG: DUF3489 domain-containing protein [Pontixanthobacter sp.]